MPLFSLQSAEETNHSLKLNIKVLLVLKHKKQFHIKFYFKFNIISKIERFLSLTRTTFYNTESDHFLKYILFYLIHIKIKKLFYIYLHLCN